MSKYIPRLAVFLSVLFVAIVGGLNVQLDQGRVKLDVQEAKAFEHPVIWA